MADESADAEQLLTRARELADAGDTGAAEATLGGLLARWPEHARALNNLGLLRTRAGAHDEAAGWLERACRAGGTARSWANLGRSYLRLDRAEEAVQALLRSVALEPALVSSWLSLAAAEERCGRREQARAAFERACEHEPANATAHNNYALLLERMGDSAAALAHLARAAELDPASAPFAWNHGDALRRGGSFDAARAELERAAALDPLRHEPWQALARVQHELGEVRAATLSARRARELAPAEAALEVGSTELFFAAHDDSVDAASLAADHRRWGELAVLRATAAPPMAQRAARGSPLRVGYLSADLREHVIPRFLAPVLATHDPARVELVLLSGTLEPDAVTAALAERHRLVDLVGLDLEQRRQRILDQRLDVLIDVGGHTSEVLVELLAQRLAPLQLTWLGYPGSTGLRTVDLRISDRDVDPSGSEVDYVERLALLPRTPWAYPVPQPPAPPAARPQGMLVMGSFNRLGKLSPTILEAWCDALERLPSARLVLRARHASQPSVQSRLRATFGPRGLWPRVECWPWATSYAEALAGLAGVDLALDSFPYHGTSSTCDALAVGTPVVSLLGTTPAARVSSSLLRAVGLSELVAPDVAGYVQRIVDLAADLPALRAGRAALRARYAAGPLSDPRGLARALEDVFESVAACSAAGP